MRYTIITIIAGLLLNLQVQAQTQDKGTDRTVVVEQEYNPDIMDTRKINVLPAVESMTTKPKNVVYDNTVSPKDSVQTIPVTAFAGKEKEEVVKPGYIRIGYGNRGNLDGKLNYLFKPSDENRLNLSASIDGMNGNLRMENKEKWNHHYYQTKLGADYWHKLSWMEIKAGGNLGLSNFNLHPKQNLLNKQKFTTGNVYAEMLSGNPRSTIQYEAGANLLFYSRGYSGKNDESTGETILRTHGNVYGALDEDRKIGVYATMDNRFYGNGFKNSTAVTVKPYYMATVKDWRFHLGINADLALGYGKNFRVSPDISAEYIFSGSCILYAKATGGRINHDFRHLEFVNPYSAIGKQTTNGYEQLNASAGIKASPFIGFWFHLYGGYQNLKDELGYAVNYLYDINDTRILLDPIFMQSDATNIYAGLHLTYDYKNLFSFSVKGQYNRWDVDEDKLLTVKPQLQFDAQVNVRPISDLNVSVGYEFMKFEKPQATSGHSQLETIGNLSLGATYKVYKDISVYVRVSNLLNKKFAYYHEYPAQGFNFVGGLSYVF